MKISNFFGIRLAALFTLLTFTATNFSYAQNLSFQSPKTEMSLTGVAGLMQAVHVPENFASVEDFSAGKEKVIFHIQNAHGNYEGEKKTERLLAYLEKEYGVKTILTEGAWNKLNPELIRFTKNKKENAKILDQLTQKALLKGFETHLFNSKASTGYGIEEEKLYNEGLRAFANTKALADQYAREIARIETNLEARHAKVFSKDLRQLVSRIERHALNQIPFEKYLHELKEMTRKYFSADLSDAKYQKLYPQLVRIFKIEELEKEINRQAFEAEKKAFLALTKPYFAGQGRSLAIPSTGTDLYGSLESLLNLKDFSAKLPNPGTTEFFLRLIQRLPPDFKYQRFRNVTHFLGLLILRSEIDAEALIAEVEKLEAELMNKLAVTKETQALVNETKTWWLTRKLIALELTPSEFERIRRFTNHEPRATTGVVGSFKNLGGAKIDTSEVGEVASARIQSVIQSALNFYSVARKRDTAMLRRIEERLRETKADKVAVITGGFHTGPFSEYFKKRGYSYAEIMPKLTDLDHTGSDHYVNVMMAFAKQTSRATGHGSRATQKGEERGLSLATMSTGINPHGALMESSQQMTTSALNSVAAAGIVRSVAVHLGIKLPNSSSALTLDGGSEYGVMGVVSQAQSAEKRVRSETRALTRNEQVERVPPGWKDFVGQAYDTYQLWQLYVDRYQQETDVAADHLIKTSVVAAAIAVIVLFLSPYISVWWFLLPAASSVIVAYQFIRYSVRVRWPAFNRMSEAAMKLNFLKWEAPTKSGSEPVAEVSKMTKTLFARLAKTKNPEIQAFAKKGLLAMDALEKATVARSELRDITFSAADRDQKWAALQSDEMQDVFVIGGGAAGAGIARDAALRGLKTLLVEKDDFASGTSSRSTKIIHAGIRYLELSWEALWRKGWGFKRRLSESWSNLKLVVGAARERKILSKIAPDLVKPLHFFIPLYKGGERPRWKVAMGAFLYSLISWLTGNGFCAFNTFNKKQTLKEFPDLDPTDLKGGFLYTDALTNDAALTRAMLYDAHYHGAAALNHVQVLGYETKKDEKGKYYEVRVKNLLFPAEDVKVIKTRKLVNAAGPWIDRVRKTGAGAAADAKPLVGLSQGIHLDIGGDFMRSFPKALFLEKEIPGKKGKIFFVVPRETEGVPYLRIGTTDFNKPDLDHVYPTDEEVQEILDQFKRYFPTVTIHRKNILSADAGLRPLAMSPTAPDDLNQASREHRIFTDEEGVIHVPGVKLTDSRRAGQQVVDQLLRSSRGVFAWKKSVAAKQKIIMPPRQVLGVNEMKSHDAEGQEPKVRAWVQNKLKYDALTTFSDLMFRHEGEKLLSSHVQETWALKTMADALQWGTERQKRELASYRTEKEKRLKFVESYFKRSEMREISAQDILPQTLQNLVKGQWDSSQAGKLGWVQVQMIDPKNKKQRVYHLIKASGDSKKARQDFDAEFSQKSGGVSFEQAVRDKQVLRVLLVGEKEKKALEKQNSKDQWDDTARAWRALPTIGKIFFIGVLLLPMLIVGSLIVYASRPYLPFAVQKIFMNEQQQKDWVVRKDLSYTRHMATASMSFVASGKLINRKDMETKAELEASQFDISPAVFAEQAWLGQLIAIKRVIQESNLDEAKDLLPDEKTIEETISRIMNSNGGGARMINSYIYANGIVTKESMDALTLLLEAAKNFETKTSRVDIEKALARQRAGAELAYLFWVVAYYDLVDSKEGVEKTKRILVELHEKKHLRYLAELKKMSDDRIAGVFQAVLKRYGPPSHRSEMRSILRVAAASVALLSAALLSAQTTEKTLPPSSKAVSAVEASNDALSHDEDGTWIVWALQRAKANGFLASPLEARLLYMDQYLSDDLPEQQKLIRDNGVVEPKFEFGPGFIYHGGEDFDKVLLTGRIAGKSYFTRTPHVWAVGSSLRNRPTPAIFMIDTKTFNRLQREGQAELGLSVHPQLDARGKVLFDSYPHIKNGFDLDEVQLVWINRSTYQHYMKLLKKENLSADQKTILNRLLNLDQQGKLRLLDVPDADPKEESISYLLYFDAMYKELEQLGLLSVVDRGKIPGYQLKQSSIYYPSTSLPKPILDWRNEAWRQTQPVSYYAYQVFRAALWAGLAWGAYSGFMVWKKRRQPVVVIAKPQQTPGRNEKKKNKKRKRSEMRGNLYVQLRELVQGNKGLIYSERLAAVSAFMRNLYPEGLPDIWKHALTVMKDMPAEDPAALEILNVWLKEFSEQLHRVDQFKPSNPEVDAYIPPAIADNREPVSYQQIVMSSPASSEEAMTPLSLPALNAIQSLSGSMEINIPVATKAPSAPTVPPDAKFEVFEVKTASGTVFATRTKENPVFDFANLSSDQREQLLGRASIHKNYGVNWDIMKIARDTIAQNYSDGHSGTLDGVRYTLTKTESGEYRLKIFGYGEYDLEKALTLGGSGKRTENGQVIEGTQGKHGEGLKVTALLLLRDHGADAVTYSSRNWRVDFAIRSEQETLAVDMSEVEDHPGNYTEIATRKPELIYELLKGINLVYHSHHPDFQEPTLNNAVGGFKFLGVQQTEGQVATLGSGNLYLQRMRYQTRNNPHGYAGSNPDWENGVPGMSLWTHQKSFLSQEIARERPPVNLHENLGAFQKAVYGILNAESTESLLKLLRLLEPVWSDFLQFEKDWNDHRRTGIYFLIEQLAEILNSRLKDENKKIVFGIDQLVAVDANYAGLSQAPQPLYERKELEDLQSQGYKVCFPALRILGVESVTNVIQPRPKINDRPLDEFEKKKLAILRDAIKLLYYEMKTSRDLTDKTDALLSRFTFLTDEQLVEGGWFDEEGVYDDWKQSFYVNREWLDGDSENSLVHVFSSDNGLNSSQLRDLYPPTYRIWAILQNTWGKKFSGRQRLMDLSLAWDQVSSEQKKLVADPAADAESIQVPAERNGDSLTDEQQRLIDHFRDLMTVNGDMTDESESMMLQMQRLLAGGVDVGGFLNRLMNEVSVSREARQKRTDAALAGTPVSIFSPNDIGADGASVNYKSLVPDLEAKPEPSLLLPSLDQIKALQSGEQQPLNVTIPVAAGEKPEPAHVDGAKSKVIKKTIEGGMIWATRTTKTPDFDFKGRNLELNSLTGRGQIDRDYGVAWPLEQVIRDLHQNNLDGHSGTLEGTRYDVRWDSAKGEYVLLIHGWGEYDLEKALTVGDSGKQTDLGAATGNAGKHGEGLTIDALLLLRKYGATKVAYASANWQVELVLPDGASTLQPRIQEVSRQEGNTVQITTPSPDLMYQILQGVNMVYYPANPDFSQEIVGSPNTAGVKYMGLDSSGRLNPGNFYMGGQRYAVIDRDDRFPKGNWAGAIEGLSFWLPESAASEWPFNRKVFDRERPPVDEANFGVALLGWTRELSQSELIRFIQLTEPYWSDIRISQRNDFENSFAAKTMLTILLEAVVDRLAEQRVQLKFPSKYIADSNGYDSDGADDLRGQGFQVSMGKMNKIGMPTVEEHLGKQALMHTATPNEIEKLRILVLAAKLLKEKGLFGGRTFEVIKLVASRPNKSVPELEIPQQILTMDFNKALLVFIRDYLVGWWGQSNSSLIGNIISGKMMSPELQGQLRVLNERWSSYGARSEMRNKSEEAAVDPAQVAVVSTQPVIALRVAEILVDWTKGVIPVSDSLKMFAKALLEARGGALLAELEASKVSDRSVLVRLKRILDVASAARSKTTQSLKQSLDMNVEAEADDFEGKSLEFLVLATAAVVMDHGQAVFAVNDPSGKMSSKKLTKSFRAVAERHGLGTMMDRVKIFTAQTKQEQMAWFRQNQKRTDAGFILSSSDDVLKGISAAHMVRIHRDGVKTQAFKEILLSAAYVQSKQDLGALALVRLSRITREFSVIGSLLDEALAAVASAISA